MKEDESSQDPGTAGSTGGMEDHGRLRDLVRVLAPHIRPYRLVLGTLALINMIPGAIMGLRPLVLAPALGVVLKSDVAPAERLADLTLDNVGPTLQGLVGDATTIPGGIFAASALTYVLLTLIAAALLASVQTSALSVRLRLYRDMIASLHNHVIRLSLRFFRNARAGELVSRFAGDLNAVVLSIDAVAMGAVQCLVQIAIGALILFRTNAQLTTLILLVGSFHFVITHFFGKWVRTRTHEAFGARATFSASLVESFQSVFVIKSFAAEGYGGKRVTAAAEKLRHTAFRSYFCKYLEDPIRILTDGVLSAVILMVCRYALINELLSLQGMVLFFYMAGQLVLPMSMLGRLMVRLKGLQGGASRIVSVLSLQPQIPDGPQSAVAFQDALTFDSVHFSHGDQPVLDDVSLTVKKGETIAIVGPSGSGKTTMLNMALRLHDPDAGTVSLDGTDVRTFTQSSYRSLFGVVPQDAFLFNDTIQENILLGRPLDQNRLAHACEVANLADMLSEMAAGLDTTVGDRGERLSGGQRQRISLARAVYGNPDILILDEATSALDAQSEVAIQNAMDTALQSMTGIVVAHRLATVVNADRIAVLDAGRIHAVGRHQELLESNDLYRHLYELQFNTTVNAAVDTD